MINTFKAIEVLGQEVYVMLFATQDRSPSLGHPMAPFYTLR